MNKVTLSTPIKVGDKKIKDIEIREPTAGELRGVKLLDIMQMDAAAYLVLLPRICTPSLSEAQIEALPMSDITRLMTGVASFFGDPINSPTA